MQKNICSYFVSVRQGGEGGVGNTIFVAQRVKNEQMFLISNFVFLSGNFLGERFKDVKSRDTKAKEYVVFYTDWVGGLMSLIKQSATCSTIQSETRISLALPLDSINAQKKF